MKSEKIKNSQKGMTAVEALVAICLFAVASTLIASFIVFSFKNHLKVNEEALALDRININIQKIVEELRKMKTGENGSFPVEEALPNEIIFYSDINKDGLAERVNYFLENGDLFKEVIIPTGEPLDYLEANAERTKIASEIINDEANPIFRYLGIDPLGGGNNLELSQPLDIFRVRLITVSLITSIGSSEKQNLVESKVMLRNLKDY
jgi:hypothetical protein